MQRKAHTQHKLKFVERKTKIYIYIYIYISKLDDLILVVIILKNKLKEIVFQTNMQQIPTQ